MTVALADLLGFPLDAATADALTAEHARLRSERPAHWIAAWTHATHPSCPDHARLLRDAYDTVWLPVLEGTPYGPAVWGAVLADLLQPWLPGNDCVHLREPWQRAVRTDAGRTGIRCESVSRLDVSRAR